MTLEAIDLQDCLHRDAQDPLRALRDLFHLPEGIVYLDGNSLGALPRSAVAAVNGMLRQEWGDGLIRSWNDAGWIALPRQVGDRIASLVGASPGTVVATDTTSTNLYKVLGAALQIAGQDAPARRTVLSERSNFPTDLYIAQSLCRQHGYTLRLVDAADLDAALTDTVAVLLLTHVNYRTGAMFDMAAVTQRAHDAGALAIWDLAHSAGAVPVALEAAQADFAVGCGYKFLNGGPGAPAFVWVHLRHTGRCAQPLSGWFGHAAPFAFSPHYEPAGGIDRYLCGTQPMLSLRALACGVDSVLAAGGGDGAAAMQALRAKSLALTDLFIALVAQRCAGHGLELVTPRDPARRGSQVSLARAEGAYPIMQALIARGVIGDFRAGDAQAPPGHADRLDILRFGFTPLYTGFADVWHAVEHLHAVLAHGEWQQPRFAHRQAVT